MANAFDSNTKIGISCSQCGTKFQKTLGELQSGNPFSCQCGKTFDSAEMMAKAQEGIAKLKEKLGGLNK